MAKSIIINCTILDDWKFQTLPDNLFKLAINLYLLSEKYGGDKVLPPLNELAWELHLDPGDTLYMLQELEMSEVGIIQCTDDGHWRVNG